YMSTDEHILGVHAFIIGDTFFETLSDDERAVVLEAATLAARIENTQKLAGAKKYIDLIREKGVEVHMTTMAEKDAFAAVSDEPGLEYRSEQVEWERVQSKLDTAEAKEAALYGR